MLDKEKTNSVSPDTGFDENETSNLRYFSLSLSLSFSLSIKIL